MQFAKELVNAALAKGEQALTQLQVAVQTGANSSALAIRSTSLGGSAGGSSTNSLSSAANAQAPELRAQRFRQELKGSRINLDALRRLAFDGVPDKEGLRATVWKVLLGYLPPCPDEWPQTLARRRTQYHVFCSELIVDPKRPMQQDGSLHATPQQDADPLASLPTSPSQAGTRTSTAGQAGSPFTHAAAAPQQGIATTGSPQAVPLQPAAPPAAVPAAGAQSADAAGLHASAQLDPLAPAAEQLAGPLASQADSGSPDPLQAAPARETAHATASRQVQQPPLLSHSDSSSPFAQTSSQQRHTATQQQLHQPQQQVPAQVQHLMQQSAFLLEQESNCADHPLSLDAGSKWRTFFQDNETLEQITRDVMRTHPDMDFFTGETEEAELHRQEMRRALFMYAKLNPGLRYIQGMNELIAPLYYLFKHDSEPRERQYAEADAFWCFLELISEFRDHFCAQLDNAQTGIRATIRRLMHVLQQCDYALWQHIEVECKVDPQYYAFRWITLLLSQEFAFPTTLRIWDTILSDPHGRMDCLLRVCTAMILHVKPRLMQGDFTVILTMLQRYPPVDVNQLLNAAAALPPCQDILGQPV